MSYLHVLYERKSWSDLATSRKMRVATSLALAINAGEIVNIAGTPLATARQLAGTQGCVATPTSCLLGLDLARALGRLRGG